MSRGVVLWPDAATAAGIRDVWNELADLGIPTLATHTHRRHQPHCSLTVAEELAADVALERVGVVPRQPIPLRVESVGVFPPSGAVVLACVPTQGLLDEQRRVHRSVQPIAVGPWPYFGVDAWVPHITVSMGMTSAQLAVAIPVVLAKLPIVGTFDRGGVEDGTTGENWPTPQVGGVDDA